MTRTTLFLHTEWPTRTALERDRPPGRLVLATDDPSPEDAAFWDDVVPLPPVEDVGATLAALRRIRADEVVVQTEYGLLAGTLLARERGLRAPTPEAALLATDKLLQRERLAAAGVAQPRFALASTAADVRRFADGAWPVVLKPVASTLGRHVLRVASDAEADDAVARLLAALPRATDVLRLHDFARIARLDLGCDPARSFLVEAYAPGPPAETDGLVFGDAPDVFGVTAQVVCAPPRFFVEGYLHPVARPELETATRAAVRALGLTDAGFSIEFRGGALIEVNGRLGEDGGFPDLFASRLGRAPILRWLDGGGPPAPRDGGGSAIAYASRYRRGVVRAAPALPPGVRGRVVAAPGARVLDPDDEGFAPHLAYVLATDPRGADAAYATARATVDALRFDVEDVA